MCRRHMLKIVDNHLSLIPLACPSTSNHPFQSHGRCCHCCLPSRSHRPLSQVQRRASLSQADDDKEPSAVADSRERASSRVIVGSGMRFFCQLPSFVCVPLRRSCAKPFVPCLQFFPYSGSAHPSISGTISNKLTNSFLPLWS